MCRFGSSGLRRSRRARGLSLCRQSMLAEPELMTLFGRADRGVVYHADATSGFDREARLGDVSRHRRCAMTMSAAAAMARIEWSTSKGGAEHRAATSQRQTDSGREGRAHALLGVRAGAR